MAVQHEDELRREIAAGRVTVILGAGVSMAATGGAPTASWIGLLTDGIDRCVAVVPGLPARWPDSMRNLLDLGREGDPEALLSVAEQITVKLGGPAGGELKRWLRETVGALRVRHPDVPRTLGELGVPLLTTNYDDVLEDATHRRALDWRDTADVERVLRGEDNAIVHLHGYWRRSENLVLGVRSYEDVLHNAHAQTVLRALRMTKTLLFVGFGAGLDDPNFGALLRWTREVFASSEVRHYRVARADEVATVQAQHKPEERVFVLSYGEKHADLAPFLAGLAPDRRVAVAGRAPVAIEADAEPRPRILVAGPFFGVPKEVRAEILKIWRVDRKANDVDTQTKALARIRVKLRSPEIRQAQLAAILRYDVILDVSPWRAFESRWSLGLRDVEREQHPREGAPVPLLYIVFSEAELPMQGRRMNAGLVARLGASRYHFSDLTTRIDELIHAGIALVGFEQTDWRSPILDCFPSARFFTGSDLGPVNDHNRFIVASAPLDAPILQPSLDDYLRALRVTAGQVTLAGETTPRPICDVYVELEIQRDEERREQASAPEREDALGTMDALREEIEARRKAAWDLPGSEVIPASAIHEVARRILLWGPAGTGKSTLLRHLACQVANEGRIPLWIPRLVELGDNLPEALAMRALQAVGLSDGPSPARTQLREAVETGQAFLFLDGFDEAPTAVRRALPQRIHDLPPDIRVVIASRPLHRMHTGLVEITLTGLPVNGAEELLGAYFKGEPWIEPLVHALDLLPDGTSWARNPVLLGLAASVYRQENALPDATLALYKKVVDNLLAPLAPSWPIDAVWVELQLLARNMLLPRTGDATVTVREGDLPYAYREALLASGLFTGDEWLRFTHLTLGEYLAASSLDFDFAAERERERARPEGRADEDSALEVLPMAHALISDEAELVNAFRDALDLEKETAGHRMLRLVLRAIGYGGKAVRAFCENEIENDETYFEKVVTVLADRLKAPSGRFGDFERQLMGDAERGFVFARRFVGAEVAAKIDAQFAPLLATWGDAGTEAHIALWNLGVRKPEKRSGDSEETVKRQARALVGAGISVDELVTLTTGTDSLVDQALAVEILGKYDEYWPVLRPLFDDGSQRIREDVVNALKDDPRSAVHIRECLNDDDGRTRMAAINAVAADPRRRAASLDRLVACLNDRHDFVRSAAVYQLIDEPEALPALRDFLEASDTTWTEFASARVIEKLAGDLKARPAIQACLENPGISLTTSTLQKLAQDPGWRPQIQRRLDYNPPDPEAMEALSGDSASLLRLRALLDDERSYVRTSAIVALANDEVAYDRILSMLRSRKEDGMVRAACVNVIKNRADSRKVLRALLSDADQNVRCAAIKALRDDPSAIAYVRKRLQDSKTMVRREAIVALARHPSLTRETLWAYFSEIEGRDSAQGILFSHLREIVVRVLRDDLGSRQRIVAALTDSSYEVRAAAVEVLMPVAPDSPLRNVLRALVDKDVSMVGDVALKALSDEPAIRERLRPMLQKDEWRLRLAGFRLLVAQTIPRQQILTLLANGPFGIRVTTIEPLAHVRTIRESLYPYLDDPEPIIRGSMVRVLRSDDGAKRHLREALSEGKITAENFDFTLREVAETLADDPAAHPLFLKLSYSVNHNVVAAVVPALANMRDRLGAGVLTCRTI